MANWGVATGGVAVDATQPMEPVTMAAEPMVYQAPAAGASLSGKSKAGYMLIGLCGGLFGVIGSWLVQADSDRKGGLKWSLIGFAISAVVGLMLMFVVFMAASSAMVSYPAESMSMGENVANVDEYIENDAVPMDDGTPTDEGMVYVGTEAEGTSVDGEADVSGVDPATVEQHEAEDTEEDHGADYITTDAEGIDNLTYPDGGEEA